MIYVRLACNKMNIQLMRYVICLYSQHIKNYKRQTKKIKLYFTQLVNKSPNVHKRNVKLYSFLNCAFLGSQSFNIYTFDLSSWLTYVLAPQIIKYLFLDKKTGLGQDLKTIDIARTRDLGVGSYNDYREYCGFKRARNFIDFLEDIDALVIL